tara:strand:- start:1008 stop:2144 length:1137 start_codon:yes stop_codon:yes gene_type:complete
MPRTIEFVSPVNLTQSKLNVESVIKKSKSLHGPGPYSLKINKLLKKKYNFKTTLLTNSCTSALEISAIAINFKEGDEVIIPSYTFITTGGSFARTKAKIVYSDIEKESLMPSFDQIKSKVSKKTKAIVIVHYQGFCVNYLFELKKYCIKKNIILVEDAAQAIGTKFKNKYLGTFGDLACFSFHHTKNIHSGIGGCLVINNSKLYKKSLFAYDKGSDRILQLKKIVKWYSWVSLGSSFLMSELHASYLYPQIIYYDKIINKRKSAYEGYLKKLDFTNKHFFLVKNTTCKEYNYHSLVLVLKQKKYDNFLEYLKKYKIHAFIGYIPLHISKYGKQFLPKKKKLINLDKIFNKIVRLPMHSNLNKDDIMFVSNKIKSFFKI